MLRIEQVQQIMLLAIDGKSRRDIAKITGICRTTVDRVCRNPERYSSARSAEDDVQPVESAPETRSVGSQISDEYERCPTCGGMVRMPCYYCKLYADVFEEIERYGL